MKPIIYVVFLMLVLPVIVHFLLADLRYYLGLGILTIGLIIWALLGSKSRSKRDAKRGWRVGHLGRDAMYYEEFRAGEWHRIEIGGEMLTGKAHHVIYFGSLKFPDWASDRRDEIVARIKSSFPPPQYEYDGL